MLAQASASQELTPFFPSGDPLGHFDLRRPDLPPF